MLGGAGPLSLWQKSWPQSRERPRLATEQRIESEQPFPKPERAQSSQAHACHPQECGALVRSTCQSTSRAGNRQDGNKAGDEDEDATKSISDALAEHQQDVPVGRYG